VNIEDDTIKAIVTAAAQVFIMSTSGWGNAPGGSRARWQTLTGSDTTLDNAHLMCMAGRFSRRLQASARAHAIPGINCPVGERKHDLAEEYLAKTEVTQGVFLILIGRAQAPVWGVTLKLQPGSANMG